MKTKDIKKKRPAGIKLPVTRLGPKPSRTSESTEPIVSSRKLKRILVPTDFSEASFNAVRYAMRFAEQSGATMHLLYVIERPALNHDFDSFPLVLPEPELTKLCKEKLLSLAGTEIEELIPVSVQVRIGKPFREIVDVARETNADLIVIATQGHSGIKHVLLGSTAELVVRYAPCPVLVVREHEHEFV
jgi:nucleotide-binding universal stress UspA family protein